MEIQDRSIARSNVRKSYPARLILNKQTLSLAERHLDQLWKEKLDGHGRFYDGNRCGSQKFAALLALRLFGGRLAGNERHLFVKLPNGKILDLNRNQPGVSSMGAEAHNIDDLYLLRPEYRRSLASCLPRVERWATRAINECPGEFLLPNSPKFSRDSDPTP